MSLRKDQWPIFIVNLIYLIIALFIFVGKENYEFILYIGVILFFLVIILLTNNKVNYPNSVLWGLTLWGILHMLGGGLILKNGSVLYTLILIQINETLNILRYDQVVHLIGFGVATLVMWILLKPSLKNKIGWTSLSIVTIMAGLGVGALNEIIEFGATLILPETGVGDYINTSMDLVADFLGALIALVWIKIKKGNI